MEEKQNSPKKNDAVNTPVTRKKTGKKKKIPLWLKIARVLYAFFSFLGQKIKAGGLIVLTFLYDFFSGLPDGIRYFREKQRIKRRKKKALKKAEKERKKAMKQSAVRSVPEKEKRRKNRKKLSEEEAELYREQEEGIEKRFLGKRAGWTAIAALFAVLFVAELGILSVMGIQRFIKRDAGKRSDIDMVLMAKEEKKKTVHIPSAAAYPYGGETVYVDLTALSDALSVGTVADADTAYYTLQNGKQMILKNGSNKLIIDGKLLCIPEAVYFRQGKVYVPLELITGYITGLTVSYSPAEGKITLTRQPDIERDTEKNPVFLELDFNTGAPEAAPLPIITED